MQRHQRAGFSLLELIVAIAIMSILAGVAYNEQGNEQAGMGIASADVDGNGTLDLVRVEPGLANLDVWQGESDGRFVGPTSIELDAPVDQIGLVDLDGDGALDIVAGSFGESRIRVLLSDP